MTLEEVRVELDAIDTQIKPLFLKRMECAGVVASVKEQTGGDVYVPEREDQILERRTEGVDPSVKTEYTAFLKLMMAVSRRSQYVILKGMQEKVISAALAAAGLDSDVPHTLVEVSFDCCKKNSNLNVFLNAAVINGITVESIDLATEEYVQHVSMTLAGNLNEPNMRALFCQMGKEAKNFKLTALR